MAVMMVCLDRSGCRPLRACSMRGMVVSKLCALPAQQLVLAGQLEACVEAVSVSHAWGLRAP